MWERLSVLTAMPSHVRVGILSPGWLLCEPLGKSASCNAIRAPKLVLLLFGFERKRANVGSPHTENSIRVSGRRMHARTKLAGHEQANKYRAQLEFIVDVHLPLAGSVVSHLATDSLTDRLSSRFNNSFCNLRIDI